MLVDRIRDGAYRLVEQWPYIRYLGMGAWWAWIWLCYNSTALFMDATGGISPSLVGDMYLLSTPAVALMMVLAAVFMNQSSALLRNSVAVVSLSLLAAAGTVFIVAGQLAGIKPLFASGAVLTGVGTSILCLMTGKVFGTLGIREVFTAGCVSVMLASLLYFMGIGLPGVLRVVFVALLPVMSALLYVIPGEDAFPADEGLVAPSSRNSSNRRLYDRMIAAVVIVVATASFGKGLTSTSVAGGEFLTLGTTVTFIIFVGAFLICLVVNAFEPAMGVRIAYDALIILGIALILGAGMGSSLAYASIGKELLWMIFTCLMAYAVFRFGFSPARAFGLGQAAYFVTSSAFWWLGSIAAPHWSGASERLIVTAVMVVAIVVVFIFVFPDRELCRIVTWKQGTASDGDGAFSGETVSPARNGSDMGDASAAELPVPDQVKLIPGKYGVSEREKEILCLFAQGRSANWIAEELVISKNTVRSHLRSVYTKLDVHNRQELLDFLAKASVSD